MFAMKALSAAIAKAGIPFHEFMHESYTTRNIAASYSHCVTQLDPASVESIPTALPLIVKKTGRFKKK
ncbi:hypothetical protein PsorP6_001501 [Peronosclerospora sorghi]|uniref:Uncharacterized protein n=1 Tax=Peronosclerospora sorghi TaxID=230839 RepID=A0ACC0WSP3_9STRA|nr:hypothetical protein PsorP6_001501 [Peronosclerospora sorghi]